MNIFLLRHCRVSILAAILSLFFATESRAAFAVAKVKQKDEGWKIVTADPTEHYGKYPRNWAELKQKLQHTYNEDTETDTNTTAILSLVFGCAGAAALIIGTANLLIWVLIVGFVFGLAATVLGALHRHRYKGLGIAGLTMGIIDMAVGAVLIPLVALILAVSTIF